MIYDEQYYVPCSFGGPATDFTDVPANEKTSMLLRRSIAITIDHPFEIKICRSLYSYYDEENDVDVVVEDEVPEFLDAQRISSSQWMLKNHIVEALKQKEIKNLTFYPLKCELKDGSISFDYSAVHVQKAIRCLHKDRASYTDKGTRSWDVGKISLDEAVLDLIPEEERLIFKLDERKDKFLYHESIVKIIEGFGATGIRFERLAKWDVGSEFD